MPGGIGSGAFVHTPPLYTLITLTCSGKHLVTVKLKGICENLGPLHVLLLSDLESISV